MVRPERFERPTAGTANQCSIQLSYERTPSLLGGRNYSSLFLDEPKTEKVLPGSVQRTILSRMMRVKKTIPR